MATATDSITVRAREIAAREAGRLLERTGASKRLYERALHSLPMGVGSSFQVGDPYPLYIREGKGSRVWDVDDNEYVDFHNGFGCMIVGHAHPKVAEAISRAAHRHPLRRADRGDRRARRGALRAVPGRAGALLQLGHRGHDARDPRRAATGREDIIKIEGSYHGHHDTVMFSVVPGSDVMGGREQPTSAPMSLGIPADVAQARPRRSVQRPRGAGPHARRARRRRSRASSSSR